MYSSNFENKILIQICDYIFSFIVQESQFGLINVGRKKIIAWFLIFFNFLICMKSQYFNINKILLFVFN